MNIKFVRMFSVLLIVILISSFVIQPASAASSCSCLKYFQNNKGLPSTGDANFSAYKYADWLSKNGYNVSYMTPSKTFIGPGQFSGAGIIINPGVLGSNSTHGHIGVVIEVKFNSSKSNWTIYFKDANSNYSYMPGYNGTRTESGCSNVGYRQITTSSLSGVSFFKWSKK